MLPLCVCLCMHGAVMLKGCARIASRWGVLACDADGWWCDNRCRYLNNNQLATLPESFGDLKVGGHLMSIKFLMVDLLFLFVIKC